MNLIGNICRSMFAISVVMLFFVNSADADILTVTYNGVFSGTAFDEQYDYGGLFGRINQDLTGRGFTAVYTFDDSLGVLSVNSNGKVGEVDGGTNFNATSPLTEASFRVGSTTLYFSTSYESFLSEDTLGTSGSTCASLNNTCVNIVQSHVATPGSSYQFLNLSLSALVVPLDIDKPFSASQIDLKTLDESDIDIHSNRIEFAGEEFDLTTNSVTLADAPGPIRPGVPEPATWVMLVMGVSIIGVATRRRNMWASDRYRSTFCQRRFTKPAPCSA